MFVLVLGMSYRYVFYLLNTVTEMYEARKARTARVDTDGSRSRAFVAATLRDVAHLTGLSPAGVSYALRGQRVSAATAEVNRQVAEAARVLKPETVKPDLPKSASSSFDVAATSLDILTADDVRAVLDAGSDFGGGQAQPQQRFLVEMVSANPTGPVTVASARNGAFSEASGPPRRRFIEMTSSSETPRSVAILATSAGFRSPSSKALIVCRL